MNEKKIATEYKYTIILFIVSFSLFVTFGLLVIKTILNFSSSPLLYIITFSVLTLFCLYGAIVFVRRFFKLYNSAKIGRVLDKNYVTSIQQLAKLAKVAPQDAKARLKFLINNDFIDDYKLINNEIYLKGADNQLVMVTEKDQKQLKEQQQTQNNSKQPQQLQATKQNNAKHPKTSSECENCGATIVFEGENTICPYCNSLVKRK